MSFDVNEGFAGMGFDLYRQWLTVLTMNLK